MTLNSQKKIRKLLELWLAEEITFIRYATFLRVKVFKNV